MSTKGFPGGSVVKNLVAKQEMQDMWILSLSQEDPLKEEMATHSSILAWEIPWTEEPGRLQSMGVTRESDWTEWAHLRDCVRKTEDGLWRRWDVIILNAHTLRKAPCWAVYIRKVLHTTLCVMGISPLYMEIGLAKLSNMSRIPWPASGAEGALEAWYPCTLLTVGRLGSTEGHRVSEHEGSVRRGMGSTD